MTIKEIIKSIEYTVVIDGKERQGDITYGTWMQSMIEKSENASSYKPEKAFDPVARENFQKYIAVAYYAGLLPKKVVETRTNKVKDGCYVFTVETFGKLIPAV